MRRLRCAVCRTRVVTHRLIDARGGPSYFCRSDAADGSTPLPRYVMAENGYPDPLDGGPAICVSASLEIHATRGDYRAQGSPSAVPCAILVIGGVEALLTPSQCAWVEGRLRALREATEDGS